jgi:hypothetical protein
VTERSDTPADDSAVETYLQHIIEFALRTLRHQVSALHTYSSIHLQYIIEPASVTVMPAA